MSFSSTWKWTHTNKHTHTLEDTLSLSITCYYMLHFAGAFLERTAHSGQEEADVQTHRRPRLVLRARDERWAQLVTARCSVEVVHKQYSSQISLSWYILLYTYFHGSYQVEDQWSKVQMLTNGRDPCEAAAFASFNAYISSQILLKTPNTYLSWYIQTNIWNTRLPSLAASTQEQCIRRCPRVLDYREGTGPEHRGEQLWGASTPSIQGRHWCWHQKGQIA